MASKKHNRTYDLVVFGATGFTGQFVAEHVVRSLPTNLRWALAGRSATKLETLASGLQKLNPDRIPPAIEICSVDETALAQLAQKTFVLATTVGPYAIHGEPAFKVCAQVGTHYIDTTGELPFVGRMTQTYQAAAAASGALMFPLSGIESVLAIVAACAVAQTLRERLHAQTGAVTAAMGMRMKPSAGTLHSVLAVFDHYSASEFLSWAAPFALSPVRPAVVRRGVQRSLVDKLTGTASHPRLGPLGLSIAGGTDAAMVERTWGLLEGTPAAFGPNFSFFEYAETRNRLQGVALSCVFALVTLLLLLPPVRWVARRLIPADDPTVREVDGMEVRFTAVGAPDPVGTPPQQAYCRATFKGSQYKLTGILVAELAHSLLADDLGLCGGVYTVGVLGQKYRDRLNLSGFRMETGIVAA